MKELQHELGIIKVPDQNDSLDDLYALANSGCPWAADTETTGLNQYAEGFAVRLVQVGTTNEAWCLRPGWHDQAIADLVQYADWHNGLSFDSQALEQGCGIPYDTVTETAYDTSVASRLLDPRGPDKGGTGHKLEQLAKHYLGTDSKGDARAGLIAEARRLKIKIKAEDIFRETPYIDAYYEYAGQDVFLGARLGVELRKLIKARGLERFVNFEMPLARRLMTLQRRGLRFDKAWAERHSAQYAEELERAEHELEQRWKITQTASYVHTSKSNIIDRFTELGVRWVKRGKPSKRYPDGAPSLDKSVLAELARKRGDVGELARTVRTARKSWHYRDYIEAMIREQGKDGRLHPAIQPMQAATHRMSVTGIPVQQFPRSDPAVRGCILAEPGEVIISADYAQVEFRVGAAVSGDQEMTRRILTGEDLHDVATSVCFGSDYTSEQRNICKGIGFGWLYMGSAKGIYQQLVEAHGEAAPTLRLVRKAHEALSDTFKQHARYARKLMKQCERNPVIVTATGRPLIVDKPWAAVNYAIQSPARDVLAVGVTQIFKRGMGDMLRLIVHDENVLSVPIDQAADIGKEIEACMSTTFRGVPIITESEIKGERWVK